jgi:predicted YcjX-like family ATPase
LSQRYADWAAETIKLSRQGARATLAGRWHAQLAELDPTAPEDEQAALAAARLFTDYLRACRDDRFAMSLLPPGRFLMPGDLAGSPALTFAPLALPPDGSASPGSLWAMMERRFEAYKDVVVRPFYRDHFARLDRQIVLVDALAAFNAGPEAVRDLEATLASVLESFRVGRAGWLSNLVRPRVDRILFAATKADHLHHTSHDRLERILARLTERAIARAKFAGAAVDVVALAAMRATREATITRGRERLPAIIGMPLAGETAGGEIFDGNTETAVFPGDLPEDPARLFDTEANGFRGLTTAAAANADFRFLRFRPPALVASAAEPPALPHIRLDRALQFLLGDRLR